MSIELTCPACGAVNAFAGDQAGRLGKCGACKTPVYLPLAEEMPPPNPNRKGPGLKTRRLDKAFLVAMLLAGVFLGAFGYHFGRPLMDRLDRKSPGDKGGDKGTARPTPPAAPPVSVDFAGNNQVFVDGSIPDGQASASFKLVAPRDGTMKIELSLRDNRLGTATDYDISVVPYVAGGILAAGRTRVSFPGLFGVAYLVNVTPVQPAFGSVKGGNFTLHCRVENSTNIDPPIGVTPPPISPLLLGNTTFTSARDIFLFNGLATANGEISRIGEARFFRVHVDDGGWLKTSFLNQQSSLLDARLSVFTNDKIFVAVADQSFAVSRGQKYFVKVEAEPIPRLNRFPTGKFAVNIQFSRLAPR